MYVGITRAQRSLHISWCERRKQGRELMPLRALALHRRNGSGTVP
jgi:superfamily I DNA/RNA helicase